MGRPRKLRSKQAMEDAWTAYKAKCDSHTITENKYNKATGCWENVEVLRPVSYQVLSFCHELGITRQAFYDTYAADPAFFDIVTRIHEECEIDVREKLETGTIPAQLAGLLLAKYGYTTKTATSVTGSVPVIIDDLSGGG